MKPLFEIGDTIYTVTATHEIGPRVQCPDCLGEKIWHVTLPSGEEFDIECQACKHGYDGPYGTVPGERTFETYVKSDTVKRVELEERDGRKFFRYNYTDEVDVYATVEKAEAAGAAVIARQQAYFAEQEAKQRSGKMREINRPYGKVDREDLRDACRELIKVAPGLDGAVAVLYKTLTGGKLPRRKKT